MENTIVDKLKKFIKKIDRAAGIQLVMICMTLVAFILLLYIQQYLPPTGSQSKLIVVDILLGIGLLIEFGYFIWHTNKHGKIDEDDEILPSGRKEQTTETKEVESAEGIVEEKNDN